MDEDLLDERNRLLRAPERDSPAPPGLTRFDVQVAGPAQEYALRLRAVLVAGLERAIIVSTVGPAIARKPVPHWFAAICGGQSDAPSFARFGAGRFNTAGHGLTMDLRSWYHAFEVSSRRAWSWWDLTLIDEKTVSIWVESRGSQTDPANFGCTELLWPAYTSGAATVSEQQYLHSQSWRNELSL